MSAMSDQPLTLAVLAQFHRDVILPDVERVVGAVESRMNARFDDVCGHFDAVYRRFDRLDQIGGDRLAAVSPGANDRPSEPSCSR
jgi:hypothetical protein